MNGVLIRTDGKANLEYYDDGYLVKPLALNWRQDGRSYVADTLACGNFVSVLPGVYGIAFTDSEGAEFQTKYDVVVK